MNLDLFIRPVIDFVFGSPKPTKRGAKRPKETARIPRLTYKRFSIRSFKAIRKVDVDLAKNNLVLLLGLNESGKTTILKAVEAFDFTNDPSAEFSPKHFTNIRRRSAVSSDDPATITATISIEDKLVLAETKRLGGHELNTAQVAAIQSFVADLNKRKTFQISRVFPFSGGNPQPHFYRFEHAKEIAGSRDLASALAAEVVQVCPFIIYFEDFKDRVPERIFVDEKSDGFDPVWYDIIDGLFYNTDPTYSVDTFLSYYKPANRRIADADTVLRQVNMTLNELFTKKWKKLSGVKGIRSTELAYDPKRKAFQLKVWDADGTNYTADERSRGALWYLSFLMKTEFRSRKLRQHSGTPVFLIDEPASNLHSTAQQNMVGDFLQLVKNTCIIYTTHSQYLISLSNIKRTYIVRKGSSGNITAVPWSDYLRQSGAQVSYYQPLANLLEIVPNSLDVPWNYAVVTEGPSDRLVLLSMHRLLRNSEPRFVVYPGTSAYNLSALVSLNLGWGASFVVFLDSDEAGIEAGQRLLANFSLDDNRVLYVPRPDSKIEDLFTAAEQSMIYEAAFGENRDRVKKKEFAAMFALVEAGQVGRAKFKACLTETTTRLFDDILGEIEARLGL